LTMPDHHEFVPDWVVPTSEPWMILGTLMELFAPTVEAISVLEGEKYVTQSLILLQLCQLENSIKAVQRKYPQAQNKVLHVVIEDMVVCITELWDKLPIDTVIASILDPRTKWYDKIPSCEVTEALKILKQEHIECNRNESMDVEVEQTGLPFGGLFDSITAVTRRKSPTQMWASDIDLYKSLPNALPRTDPLLWWKTNQFQFPTLATLAKRYLAIPASQASCERLFSIAKNDVTETRTRILPELVEALLMLRKKKDILAIVDAI